MIPLSLFAVTLHQLAWKIGLINGAGLNMFAPAAYLRKVEPITRDKVIHTSHALFQKWRHRASTFTSFRHFQVWCRAVVSLTRANAKVDLYSQPKYGLRYLLFLGMETRSVRTLMSFTLLHIHMCHVSWAVSPVSHTNWSCKALCSGPDRVSAC